MMQIDQPLIGFLAAMADSDFSAPFYIAGFFQLTLFLLGMFKKFANRIWYKVSIGIALLILPAMLLVGFYFAIQPVA